MSDEEIERAIDFLLKSQANLDARVEQTNEQVSRLTDNVSRLGEQVSQLADNVSQLGEQVAQLTGNVSQLTHNLDEFADTQADIMRVMTRTFEAQAQINESLRAAHVSLSQKVETMSQKMEMLGDGQADTDRRLNTLIDIVEGGRGR